MIGERQNLRMLKRMPRKYDLIASVEAINSTILAKFVLVSLRSCL